MQRKQLLVAAPVFVGQEDILAIVAAMGFDRVVKGSVPLLSLAVVPLPSVPLLPRRTNAETRVITRYPIVVNLAKLRYVNCGNSIVCVRFRVA